MATPLDQVRQALLDSRLSKDTQVSFGNSLSIIRILLDNGCCARCCLRYLGCTDFRLYALDETDLFTYFDTLYTEKGNMESLTPPNGICTACLGAIQYADSFVDDVCERLAKEDYKADSVCLTCTLPVSILSRDHLMKVHVLNTLAAQNEVDLVRIWGGDKDVRDPKDFFKYLFGLGLTKKTHLMLDSDAPLRMNVVVGHEPTSKEHLFLTELKEPLLNVRTMRQKKIRVTVGDSRSCIVEALKKLDSNEAKEVTAIPPVRPTEKAKFHTVDLLHVSSHVGGRYLKFSREYSQTPWAIKGQKLAEHSVSDCFEDLIRKYHRADSTKFVTAGREDANVRMLGTGRPFYLEIINPRTPRLTDAEYKAMEDEINSNPIHKDNVQVRHLGFINPADTSIIKEGEETKTKRYRALVWLSEPLTDDLIERINRIGSQEFTIQQKTPVRVFQRRSAAIRPKIIHTSTIARLNPNVDLSSPEACYGVLKLHTQAGTYIKEYVHGDLGRTLPNLASVGEIHSADLLELDVMDVDLVWPPVAVETEAVPMVIDESNENNKRAHTNVL
ncbi:hypothetical protein INT47_006781 [Mucor saturninus]|uniref:tRNA pseudouridine(55) synthase n=1 Tax=Mucor saturninus TaxID=64648 RepID=A0A8H7V2T0_9FUNG|nr:hypothetical protein INT47_006781 [Mucor saturninus]